MMASTVDTAFAAAATGTHASAPAPWAPAARVAFRFGVVYFTLYVLTTQMLGGLLPVPGDYIPDIGGTRPFVALFSWVARHVFRVGYEFMTRETGSGDRTLDFVQVFCLLVVAAVSTIAWSVRDRDRLHYDHLRRWFWIFLRFAVGSTMVTYGILKAVPVQMPAPSLLRLLEPYGNFSPMGVLWASVGASRAYEITVGCVELAGAILLFVPRLWRIGALITLGDSMMIFTLNMTYDIPVKLFSFQLIVMSLFLLAPDLPRVADLLVFERPVAPPADLSVARTRRGRLLSTTFQLLFGAAIVGLGIYGARTAWYQYGGGRPKSPLHGIWTVDEMSVDGQVRSPLLTDYGRWKRVLIEDPTLRFQRMDDTYLVYLAATDANARTVTLTKPSDQTSKAVLSFERPDATHLQIEGTLDGHPVRMRLQRVDETKFLLNTRGFHWISEMPFNR
jgi:hypothetical protein